MEGLGNLVTTQVKHADVLVISKADAVDDDTLADAAEKVREFNQKAVLFNVSAWTGLGLDRLKECVLTMEVKNY